MFSGSNKQFSKVFRYSVWPECVTRPRYCYLFSTTTKSTKQFFFFAEIAFRECLVRNTEGTKHFPKLKHFQESKTLPKIQNTSQNPKHLLLWDVFLDSGKCFGFWEMFWILESVFGFWEMFWILGSVLDSGKCFGFWKVFLDSGTCFWILGSVLDSGKCFVQTSHGLTSSENKQ